MITTTVKKALDDEVDGYKTKNMLTGHTLYIVKNDEVVFYIGKSNDPITRLAQHYGRSDWLHDPSPLGQCIIDNEPESLLWTVELRTIAECEKEMLEHGPGFMQRYYHDIIENSKEQQTYLYDAGIVSVCEIALIEAYRPCLNTADNSNGRELPNKYMKQANSSSRYLPKF